MQWKKRQLNDEEDYVVIIIEAKLTKNVKIANVTAQVIILFIYLHFTMLCFL